MRFVVSIILIIFFFVPTTSFAGLESFADYPKQENEVSRDEIAFVKTMTNIALYSATTLFFVAWLYGWFKWWAYSGYWGDIDEAQGLLAVSSVGLFGSLFAILMFYFLGDKLIASFLRSWNNLF